ncbi:hypothetical protein CONLIGDRAFT_636067 [Coniochaeta ligniaria NRRL 30616]|uniref:WAP domain-containing protein n=1 Tax=Coniochaeta ligniaria NRRL 30616 TaxID=1408157 RepID=A0A1J7ICA1_9PEZI|nr:hypothetical protein CONLIGDRAFT_636067 [Coniochaeta ligniaria NRRL 30616]
MKLTCTTILTVLAALPPAWTTPTPEDNAAEPSPRDVFQLWASLPRDPSGHGLTHLAQDGVLRTVNAKREVLSEIKLTREEVAALPARSPGVSKPRRGVLQDRACIDYACDEDEDCNAECRFGCWYQDPPGAYRCM